MAQRLLIVAGEASGDLHGGNLAGACAQQPTLQLLGVGGRRMREAGVELLFDIRDLAVVGAVEAVHSLRHCGQSTACCWLRSNAHRSMPSC